jgi:hypothetical protein
VHTGDVAGVQIDRVGKCGRLRPADRWAFATRRSQGGHHYARQEREHEHRYDDDPTHRAIIALLRSGTLSEPHPVPIDHR